MENIFDGAKFGDLYLTRQGQKSVIICIADALPNITLITEGGCSITCDKQGKAISYGGANLEGFDIVSKYQEPFDETKLDELATKALETTNPTTLLNKVEAFDLGFKIGYRKAKEE